METTTLGGVIALYPYRGYRLVRVRGDQVVSYTYDYNENGVRDSASCVPIGRLNLSYTTPNDGSRTRKRKKKVAGRDRR